MLSELKQKINSSVWHDRIKWLFKGGMRVCALVGKSGTGKSFRSQLVAEKKGVSLIIDDGLVIHNRKIVCGYSAKREVLYTKAIKRALFTDPEHRKEVVEYLEQAKEKKILLIGTSKKMVNKIAHTLEIPPVSEFIEIEDVATRQEIEMAIHSRKEGKHVIPAPSIEVKKHYAHIIYHSIKVFFKRGFFRSKKNKFYEKTIVRPHFHNKGAVSMSEAALTQMILHCIDEYDCRIKVKKVRVNKAWNKYWIRIFLNAYYGETLSISLYELQKFIIDKVEQFTGIIIEDLRFSVINISREVKK